VCADHGVPLGAAALRFPLRHPSVASVLVGCRSAAEVDENADLFDLDIPDALWEDL
jgi:D-threo-aldose 1-dehydrogenase